MYLQCSERFLQHAAGSRQYDATATSVLGPLGNIACDPIGFIVKSGERLRRYGRIRPVPRLRAQGHLAARPALIVNDKVVGYVDDALRTAIIFGKSNYRHVEIPLEIVDSFWAGTVPLIE